MKQINELDAVVLNRDLPEYKLLRGDVGAVVMVHGKGEAYEVEFVGYDGHTVALLTLPLQDIRSMSERDLPHARELSAA